MTEFNYQTICQNTLLEDLPERTRKVVARRFGLLGRKETLESIGRDFGITRERVRQIEEDGLRRLKEKLENPVCQNVFRYFAAELKKSGNLKKEEILLSRLGSPRFEHHVFFLLTLGEPFERFRETKDLHALWTTDRNSLKVARSAIDSFIFELKKKNQSLPLPRNILFPYIEISKNILKGPEGLYGLKDWPEINPRGIKDRAYIILKKEKTPLHFAQVARAISKNALCQTVHNELIKDPRFVLVGRGLYTLEERGYKPGIVREVISEVLECSQKPMDKNKIVEKVLKQRWVKVNTILLNLQNKKYFVKNSGGKYTVRKA